MNRRMFDHSTRGSPTVLNRIGQPYELVFVDDGSRDQTPANPG